MNSREVQKQLDAIGIRAARLRGQHFLIDEQVLAAIGEAAELKTNDAVLEIGPGLGVLTRELVRQVRCLIAVEIDLALAEHLAATIHEPSFHLIRGDARRFSAKELIAPCGSQSYKLVANIPYRITSELLVKFLGEEPAPSLMVLLVQREVAERIIASPPHLSRLAVFVQYFGKPEIVRQVSRNSFFPPPRADSAILRIRRNPQSVFDIREREVSRKNFFRFVERGFHLPRRKLIGNLKGMAPEQKNFLEWVFRAAKIDPNVRPGNLRFGEWMELAKAFFTRQERRTGK